METPPHKAETMRLDEAVKFDEVYRKEWEEIQTRRATQLYISRAKDSHDKDCKPEALTGLALSGGGIRSATFCLGLLQGMHSLKMLRIFDYLSTVSGGGYVGGWWSAWLARQQVASSIQEESVEPDFALLCPEDIKNPSNLAIKLRGSGDQSSVTLRERFSPETKQLLARYRDQGPPSAALIDALVKELNLAIISKTLSILLKGEEPEESVEGIQHKTVEELRFEEHSVWSNRLLLEEAYPFEIKGLFPPREKIEPERSRVGAQSLGQKEGESSKNAWKDPIHHLRLYANYLTPRRGLLSADTWRAVSTITGNLIMTWLIMLPLLTAVMLLGQLYFLLHPSIGGDRLFAGNVAAGDLLSAMIPPLAAILGWLGAMAIAWLLCNRDRSTSTDLIMQGACLVGVIALVLSGVTVFTGKSLLRLLESVVNTSARLWALIGWLIVLVVLLCVACLQPSIPVPPTEEPGTTARWRSELRRNKISHMQAWLLVLFVMLALVLLLSGFSHPIISYLSNIKGLNIPLAWLPVVSAIAGSIFTAMKATPSGGGDKLESRQPSLVSRFVFAVTPGLVVSVLTVTVAWMGHHLLKYIWGNGNIDPFLTVAAFYGISLCFALAIYEMTWPDEYKFPLVLLAFACLLTVNVSWGAHALITYLLFQELRTSILLFPIIVFGICVTHIAFTRIAIKEKWKQFLGTKPLWEKKLQERPGLLWVFLIIFVPTLFGIGFLLSLSYEKGKAYVVNPTAVALGLAALAGSLILFRLAVVRRTDEEHSFELKWFRGKAIGQRPEALWLLASVCLALPIAVSSWVQAILEYNKPNYTFRDTLPLIFFPLVIALLPSCLILFRTLAIQIKEGSDSSNENKKQNILDWAIRKIPRAETRKHVVLRMLACFGIGGAIIAGYAIKKLTRGSLASLESVGVSLNLILIGLAIAFAAIVAIFKLAVFQIPVKKISKPSVSRRKKTRPSRLRRPGFIWLLAGTCIALAIWVGYLTSVWSQHIQENLWLSLSSVALPGMAACFPLTFFEMWWGQSDNRRSIWLLAAAYLGLSMFFVIGWIMASNTWLSAFNNNQWEVYIKPLRIVFGLLAAALVWVVALGWMVDPNTVSMHQFYKARLVRAYLGASNPRRLKEHKEIANAVAGDDVSLSLLKNCQRGAPYHLINTTLNLVAGRDLSTAQRSASSFILSKNYCGSLRTNYRPTDSYMNGRLSLGTAVAASGAAVSPSMGSKKPTAAMAMLLTLLNVRLGYWSPTPNKENWKMSQPRLWPFYLLREFLSQTNDLSSYCYLTDGGHFDNTGLYSLVERGCRYIVLVDCGADPQPSCFQDLGDAIRRCRIDFGAEVDLKLDNLIENKCQSATQYFAVGEIKYSREHAKALHWKIEARENDKDEEAELRGILIYFKPTILGKETADVRQYAIENKFFPQQSTANQWFGEAQFESYRRLGQSYAKEAFEKLEAVKRINRRIRLSPKDVEAIFVEIYDKYNPKSDQPEETSDQSEE